MDEDDVDMTAGEIELFRDLESVSPVVGGIIRDHERLNGEIFSILLLDEIAQWFELTYRQRGIHPDIFAEALAVVGTIDEHYMRASTEDRNSIAVGFIEPFLSFVPSIKSGVSAFPALLREEFERMRSWTPPPSSTVSESE